MKVGIFLDIGPADCDCPNFNVWIGNIYSGVVSDCSGFLNEFITFFLKATDEGTVGFCDGINCFVFINGEFLQSNVAKMNTSVAVRMTVVVTGQEASGAHSCGAGVAPPVENDTVVGTVGKFLFHSARNVDSIRLNLNIEYIQNIICTKSFTK